MISCRTDRDSSVSFFFSVSCRWRFFPFRVTFFDKNTIFATVMGKKNKIISVFFVAMAVACFIVVAMGYHFVLSPIVKVEKASTLKLYADESVDEVTAKVQSASGSDIRGFRWLTAVNACRSRQPQTDYHPFQAGSYVVKAGDSMRDIWNRLASGNQTAVNVVVGSPRTLDRLAGTLGKQLMADSLAFITAFSNDTLVKALGYDADTLPALFLPNTYQFYWTITPEAFLDRMKKEHEIFWNDQRLSLAQAQGLTPTEVATLASIVDEETNKNDEKPIVAGLYLNRLRLGIPLQADPTVKYAVGDATLRRILYAHLDVDSPYNTYKYIGLPPGPIRIASMRGIDAVLHATKHSYLYMCAREDFSGYHNFATTLADHNANARRYQAALNLRGIK